MSMFWRCNLIKLGLAIASLACTAPVAANCIGNNHVRPADIVSDEVNKLFNEKNYKKLDELAAQYEKEKTATFDQVAALSAFYRGIAQDFNACSPSRKTLDEWDAHTQSIIAWEEQFPNSMPAKLAFALNAIDAAWRTRGSGSAANVSANSMKYFKDIIAIAREKFELIAAANRNNPAWYDGMMKVALAQGWKPADFTALFEQAAKLDPYYLDIHYTNTEFFAPQWYGDSVQMHAAIARSVELTKKKMGQTMFARLHWTQRVSSQDFISGGVSWKRMKAGFEDFIRTYPEKRVRNGFAMHACMAHDAKTVKGQLDKLEQGFDVAVWRDKNLISYCVAVARNSETGKATQCTANPADPDELRCE